MKNTDKRQLTSDYAPYQAFWEGFVDYRHGLHRNPYEAVPTQDVNSKLGIEAKRPACVRCGQSGAYDRQGGGEACDRWQRHRGFVTTLAPAEARSLFSGVVKR